MQIYNDFNTTVCKALEEIDPKWLSYDGIVICGTHSPDNWEQQIEKIREAREKGIPALLICFGYQLGAVEYARNVLGIKDATSEEFGQGSQVVKKRVGGLKVGLHDGETYWNNYEVIPSMIRRWEMPDNFVACQFHPEYQSSKDKPHKLLVEFINKCKKYAVVS